MSETKVLPYVLLVFRLVVGLTMMYYGSQKLFGIFGGSGFNPTLTMFQDKMGIPPVLGALAIFAEFAGGLGVLLGAVTRVAAFGIFCTMAVATFMGAKSITTLEMVNGVDPIRGTAYPLLICTIAFALVLLGGGSFSVDSKLLRRKKK